MSNWVPITLAKLTNAKIAALVTALREAGLGDGQADPMDDIIDQVTVRIRAEVAGCKTNVLDADETLIPKDLLSLGARMVLREMQSRLRKPLTDDEQTEQKNDLAYLQRIAECKVPVATPDTAMATANVQQGGSAQVVQSGNGKVNKSSLNGLI